MLIAAVWKEAIIEANYASHFFLFFHLVNIAN